MIDETVSFLQALVINILLIAVLIISMEWIAPEIPPNLNAMEATTVNERVFQAAFQQMEKETAHRKTEELAKQQSFEEQQTSLETEKMRLAQLEIEEIDRKQREAEEQRRKAEEQRLAQIAFERAERLRKQKEAEETRRRTEENRRKKEAQAELERQRKEKAKRQAQEKAVQEKQQQATSEWEKRRQAETEKQAELDRNRREEAEKSRRQAEQAQQRRGQEISKKQAEKKRQAESARKQEVNQERVKTVEGLIRQKINSYWFWPRGTEHLSCSVRVYLLPGGKVIKVEMLRSSGDAAFDNTAIRATYDASPLPVPADVFDSFRSFKFLFDPSA